MLLSTNYEVYTAKNMWTAVLKYEPDEVRPYGIRNAIVKISGHPTGQNRMKLQIISFNQRKDGKTTDGVSEAG